MKYLEEVFTENSKESHLLQNIDFKLYWKKLLLYMQLPV